MEYYNIHEEESNQPTIIGRLLRWCLYTCIGLLLFVDCVQRFWL